MMQMQNERARPRRLSKRAIRVWAALAGAVSFVLPWTAIRLAPKPVAAGPPPQVVYVPPGSRVVVQTGPGTGSTGVRVVPGGAAAGPVVTTGASHPPPGV